ncbi:unnamed protein product, partial [Mesorhabditis spiculigera]
MPDDRPNASKALEKAKAIKNPPPPPPKVGWAVPDTPKFRAPMDYDPLKERGGITEQRFFIQRALP